MTSNEAEWGQRKGLVLWSLVFVAISVLALWTVFTFVANRQLRYSPVLSDPLFWLRMLGLLLIYYAADGLRLYAVIRSLGASVAAKPMARLVFINLLFSNVTPLATGGGMAQMWFMRRHGMPLGVAGAATTIRTLLAIAVIFVGTPVCLWLIDSMAQSGLMRSIALSLSLLALGYVAFFVMLLWRRQWVAAALVAVFAGANRLGYLSDRRMHRWRRRVLRELVHFSRSFRQFLHGPPRWVALSMIFTVVFLLALFSFPALIMGELSVSVDYWISTGTALVTTFLMYFAPTPGASGVAEGAFAQLFGPLLPSGKLVLVLVLWRGLTIYLGMLIGVLALHLERKAPHD